MNSVCRFRISSLSHLKLKNGSFLNIKVGQIPSVSTSYLLRPTCPLQIQFQSFWETFPSKVRSLHVKDNLERDSHEIVYRSKFFSYVFYAELFSLCAFATQFVYSAYYAYRSMVLNEAVATTSQMGPFTVYYDAVSLAILFSFSCQFLFVYYLCQRPLLRVYYNENTDEYVLVSLSSNPFTSRLLHCKPGELQPLDVEKTLVLLGNHKFKGKKLFINQNNFKSPWHYNRLVGYV